MITLKHFRYFVDVVDAGSYTKAAAKTHISRQTLSGTVHELEETYSQKIFIQQNSFLELTPFGRFLYEKSKCILYDFDQLQYEALHFSEISYSVDLHHELLSISPELKSSVLAYIRNHSDELLEFTETYTPEEALQRIIKNEISCGFFLAMSEITTCWSVSIMKFPVYAIVNQTHPLAHFKEITLDQVLDSVNICFGRPEIFYRPLHQKRVETVSTSPIIIEPNTLKASQFMTKHTNALMLSVPSLDIQQKYKHLNVIPVIDAIWTLQLVGNKDSAMVDYCQAFGHEILAQLNNPDCKRQINCV